MVRSRRLLTGIDLELAAERCFVVGKRNLEQVKSEAQDLALSDESLVLLARALAELGDALVGFLDGRNREFGELAGTEDAEHRFDDVELSLRVVLFSEHVLHVAVLVFAEESDELEQLQGEDRVFEVFGDDRVFDAVEKDCEAVQVGVDALEEELGGMAVCLQGRVERVSHILGVNGELRRGGPRA